MSFTDMQSYWNHQTSFDDSKYIECWFLSSCYPAISTLESVIDVGQGISVGPGRFGKKNKRRALNKHRAWKIWKKE